MWLPFFLAAGGRAATGDTLPSPLAYADALGNIALSTDPAFSPINLTDDWKGDTNPALSPDGRRLAFARQEAGNWDIYVMNADGSGLTRLTTHAAADRYPTWSPGGARLAFQTDRDGNSELYVLAVAGPPGNETNLTRSPGDEREPAWSPDGTLIAFARDYSVYVIAGDTPASATPLRLFDTGPSPQPAWRPFNLPPRAWLPAVRG